MSQEAGYKEFDGLKDHLYSLKDWMPTSWKKAAVSLGLAGAVALTGVASGCKQYNPTTTKPSITSYTQPPTTVITTTTTPPTTIPNNMYAPNNEYAILVQSFDPSNGALPLEVDEMRDFLIEKEGWKKDNITELLYDKATFTNFQDAIDKVAGEVNENDLVYVALSGHGAVGGGVILPPGYPSTTLPPYAQIDMELDKIKAGELIVNIDSCYSGSAIQYMEDGPCPRIVMTSSNGDQESAGDFINYLAEILGEYPSYAAVADGDVTVPDSLEVPNSSPKCYICFNYFAASKPFVGTRLGNQDGYVSLDEAFKFYLIWLLGCNDTLHPQICDPNGLAPETYLGEYKIVG